MGRSVTIAGFLYCEDRTHIVNNLLLYYWGEREFLICAYSTSWALRIIKQNMLNITPNIFKSRKSLKLYKLAYTSVYFNYSFYGYNHVFVLRSPTKYGSELVCVSKPWVTLDLLVTQKLTKDQEILLTVVDAAHKRSCSLHSSGFRLCSCAVFCASP